MRNDAACKHAHSVGGIVGESNIANFWKEHYEQLYNCLPDNGAKEKFYEKLHCASYINANSCPIITVHDICDALNKQKKAKAMGADGIPMEAFMCGSVRLFVHICLLFNMFLRFNYLPGNDVMQSIIVPIVKSKNGDLSDQNNYRAIAIFTTVSKLFESVIACYCVSEAECDKYQYGFKAGHSTTLCTSVFKRMVSHYTARGSHVFSCFIDFTKAFDKVNYWKLFTKLIDDDVNVKVVGLLAFWYSRQQMCVKWQNAMSAVMGTFNYSS